MKPPPLPRRAPHVAATVVFAALLLFGSPAGSLAGQGAPAPPPLTLLSKEGRRVIQVTMVGSQEFVALDELATVFQLAVREESGAVTVTYKGKTIVLTPDQALASVAGRLISLPAPLTRAGRRLLVPVEFISRALALVYDARLDLRRASHLLVAGDLRVPQVTIRSESAGASARLTVDATPRAGNTVSQENERLVIKFDADALDLVPPQLAPQAGNIVQGVRLMDPVSLAVDLGPRFAAFRASTQTLDNASRLVIDMLAAQTEPAAVPSVTAAVTPAPPPPELSAVGQPVPAIRTIAIDPGHGGDDEGAAGAAGTKEKDVTLGVARRLKASIESRLGIRVLLTREDDRSVAIDNRAAMANNNKADVFISLHASASRRPGAAGASIFYAAFDKGAEDAARASLGSERLPTFAGGSRDIELVVWDLAQIRHADQSAELAKILEEQLRGHVPLGPHSLDSAPLRVLESANMPAVVVEMGYLSNGDQEKQLTSADFQNAFVQAVVDAVVKFREYLDADRRAASAWPAGAQTAGGRP